MFCFLFNMGTLNSYYDKTKTAFCVEQYKTLFEFEKDNEWILWLENQFR